MKNIFLQHRIGETTTSTDCVLQLCTTMHAVYDVCHTTRWCTQTAKIKQQFKLSMHCTRARVNCTSLLSILHLITRLEFILITTTYVSSGWAQTTSRRDASVAKSTTTRRIDCHTCCVALFVRRCITLHPAPCYCMFYYRCNSFQASITCRTQIDVP